MGLLIRFFFLMSICIRIKYLRRVYGARGFYEVQVLRFLYDEYFELWLRYNLDLEDECFFL